MVEIRSLSCLVDSLSAKFRAMITLRTDLKFVSITACSMLRLVHVVCVGRLTSIVIKAMFLLPSLVRASILTTGIPQPGAHFFISQDRMLYCLAGSAVGGMFRGGGQLMSFIEEYFVEEGAAVARSLVEEGAAMCWEDNRQGSVKGRG